MRYPIPFKRHPERSEGSRFSSPSSPPIPLFQRGIQGDLTRSTPNPTPSKSVIIPLKCHPERSEGSRLLHQGILSGPLPPLLLGLSQKGSPSRPFAGHLSPPTAPPSYLHRHPERSEGSLPARLRSMRKPGVFIEAPHQSVRSFGLRPQDDSKSLPCCPLRILGQPHQGGFNQVNAQSPRPQKASSFPLNVILSAAKDLVFSALSYTSAPFLTPCPLKSVGCRACPAQPRNHQATPLSPSQPTAGSYFSFPAHLVRHPILFKCHPERSEGSRLSSLSSFPLFQRGIQGDLTPAAPNSTPSKSVIIPLKCHAERSEGSRFCPFPSPPDPPLLKGDLGGFNQVNAQSPALKKCLPEHSNGSHKCHIYVT